MKHLVASPCCQPGWSLDEALSTFSRLGFRKFEWFDHWVKSAFDVGGDPKLYVDKAQEHNLSYVSAHLPKVREGDDNSFRVAMTAACFVKATGSQIAIFKAETREACKRYLPAFLDQAERKGLTTVIQNHRKSAVQTLGDYEDILASVADDRLKVLLEVGHLKYMGIDWPEAVELLGDRVALIHVKDIRDSECVPFGEGQIDFPGLIAEMKARKYSGDWVIELDRPTRNNVEHNLRKAIDYFGGLGLS